MEEVKMRFKDKIIDKLNELLVVRNWRCDLL